MNADLVSQWEARLAGAGFTLMAASGTQAAPVDEAPWAVRLLAGVGGFIGGIMVLLMFGLGLASLKIFETPEALVFLGLMLAVGAVVVYRAGERSMAAAQFGLAVSVAAQLALAAGTSSLFKGQGHPSWWPLVALQMLLVVLIANGLHRSLVTGAIAVLGSLSCRDIDALALWWAALTLGAALWMTAESRLLARGRAAAVAPPVFGVLAGLLLMQTPWLFMLWGQRGVMAHAPWHWAAALPALLVAVWFASAQATLLARLSALTLALAAGGLGLWLPGWTTALVLAVLGLACARPGWAAVAAVALIWSVSRFYYSLEVTLLVKAGWMAAAGLACLVLAALVRIAGVKATLKEVAQ